MAVLKFRAWHKKAKKFYECVGFESLKNAAGVCYVKNPIKKKGAPSVLGDKAEDYEITQSTGLKDSFGVEIYEGDWVLTYEDSESPYLVIWDAKAACWGLIQDVLADWTLLAGHSELFKVVGNLYQNPEFQQKLIGQ